MKPSLLEATREKLRKLLIDGDLTSEELVNILSLAQTEIYDRKGPCLTAMIDVTP
jgi:hypothetical protein